MRAIFLEIQPNDIYCMLSNDIKATQKRLRLIHLFWQINVFGRRAQAQKLANVYFDCYEIKYGQSIGS